MLGSTSGVGRGLLQVGHSRARAQQVQQRGRGDCWMDRADEGVCRHGGAMLMEGETPRHM